MNERRASLPTFRHQHHRPWWLAAVLSIAAQLLAPQTISVACVPNERAFHGYSFLKLDILREQERQAIAPLFLRFDKLYAEHFEAAQKSAQDENLAEWGERFCGLAKLADMAFVIYEATISDLEQLLSAAASKSLPVPPALRGNTMAEHLHEKKCTETIDYLVFAKKCEPHVTTSDPWKAPPRDQETMKRLIGEGKRRFRETKSAYIRLRYAFQVVRLAHYAGLHSQVLELCDDLLPKVDKQGSRWSESMVPWWIEGHRAGALRKLGFHAEAAYLYAKVFLHCPGKRASAYQSFYIKTDAEWDECLRLCQSDAERATLYAIRASGTESRALEDMEKIYAIDPASPHLEVLLVQEMRKMERNLLGLTFNPKKDSNKRYHKTPKPYAGKYVIDLQRFVRNCREEGLVERPSLWYIAEGYLELLAGDYYAADLTFKAAQQEVADKALKEQLQAFRAVLKIAAFDQPDAEAEQFAYDLLMEGKLYKAYPGFADFLKDKMAWLYLQHQQDGKAFLSTHPLSDLKPNPRTELLEGLIALALKPDQTPFERLLMQDHPASELLDMKASLHLAKGEWEAAYDTYRRIPASNWDDFGQFDPFRETYKDCVHCKPSSDSLGLSAFFNKGELIEKLVDLELRAKADFDGAARHYYQLGLAVYNMSYFGYAWKAMDDFRSGSTWASLHRSADGVFPYPKYPFGNREYTDLGRALYYFEKARALATTEELAAKACFQAARCEQKLFFQTPRYQPDPSGNRIPRLPEDYLVNFSRLKEQYRHTAFYQLAIKECKYFAVYAGK